MGLSLGTEDLGVARFVRVVNPSSADVDLVETYGRSARWITVVDGAGTIVITGTDGTDVTLPQMAAGHTHLVSVKAIKDTSTETSVIVGF